MATATMTKSVSKNGKRLGRPPVFTPAQRRSVSKYLRAHGLTKGIEMAAKSVKDGGCGIKVSVPTAMKIAERYGIEFTRGRPCNQ